MVYVKLLSSLQLTGPHYEWTLPQSSSPVPTVDMKMSAAALMAMSEDRRMQLCQADVNVQSAILVGYGQQHQLFKLHICHSGRPCSSPFPSRRHFPFVPTSWTSGEMHQVPTCVLCLVDSTLVASK